MVQNLGCNCAIVIKYLNLCISEIWDKCYSPSERFCFDPPPAPFNGGKSDWDAISYTGGKTPYNTYVNYSCGLGRKLVKYTPNDTIVYDSIELHCEWNRTWTPVGPVSVEWQIKEIMVLRDNRIFCRSMIVNGSSVLILLCQRA